MATLVALARNWIKGAKVLYILGYGFDDNNSRRIGLDPGPDHPERAIMFTNYGNLNTVNKAASRLFTRTPDYFTGDTVFRSAHKGYIEKSERKVYEAIEKDFYPLEVIFGPPFNSDQPH
jgi:hypothetical protein